ncbi:hypothetical protein KSS87_021480, partial [Heliosperma pusillum]
MHFGYPRCTRLFGDRDNWEHYGGIDVYLTPSSFGQANTLEALNKDMKAGVFVLKGREDIFAQELGKTDHPSCVPGVPNGMSISAYQNFPFPKNLTGVSACVKRLIVNSMEDGGERREEGRGGCGRSEKREEGGERREDGRGGQRRAVVDRGEEGRRWRGDKGGGRWIGMRAAGGGLVVEEGRGWWTVQATWSGGRRQVVWRQ